MEKVLGVGSGCLRNCDNSPPAKPKKNVVEKWCYFPELYKMTKVQEDGIKMG